MKDGLLSKLDELTAYNKRGHPLPLGKSFLRRVHKSRADRQSKLLENVLGQKLPRKDGGYPFSDIKAAVSTLEKTEDQFAAAEIIDQMQAYYETAIVTFIDNVTTLGIENCLLDPLSGILTSQTINNMEDKQVQDLAGEASHITEERDRLIREQEKLQNSLSVLNQCKIQKKFHPKPFTDQPEPSKSAEVPGRPVTAKPFQWPKWPKSKGNSIFASQDNFLATAHASQPPVSSGGGLFGGPSITDMSTPKGAGFFGSPPSSDLFGSGGSNLSHVTNTPGPQQSPLFPATAFVPSGKSSGASVFKFPNK